MNSCLGAAFLHPQEFPPLAVTLGKKKQRRHAPPNRGPRPSFCAWCDQRDHAVQASRFFVARANSMAALSIKSRRDHSGRLQTFSYQMLSGPPCQGSFRAVEFRHADLQIFFLDPSFGPPSPPSLFHEVFVSLDHIDRFVALEEVVQDGQVFLRVCTRSRHLNLKSKFHTNRSCKINRRPVKRCSDCKPVQKKKSSFPYAFSTSSSKVPSTDLSSNAPRQPGLSTSAAVPNQCTVPLCDSPSGAPEAAIIGPLEPSSPNPLDEIIWSSHRAFGATSTPDEEPRDLYSPGEWFSDISNDFRTRQRVEDYFAVSYPAPPHENLFDFSPPSEHF